MDRIVGNNRKRNTGTRIVSPLLRTLLLAVFMTLLAPGICGAGEKRLVILNGYNEGAPWAQEIITPIMREISRMDDFRPVEVVHMNCTQIHDSDDYDRMARGIFDRFAGNRPDYVVLVGNFAFTLRDRIKRDWGDVPMLLVAQSDSYWPLEFYFTYAGGEAPPASARGARPLDTLRKEYNFTLVQSPSLCKETIEMMVHMFPKMEKLVFVADELYVNRHLNGEIYDYLKLNYPYIGYEWLVGNQNNGRLLQNYLNDMDTRTGLLLSTWFFERTTVHGYPQLMAGEARMISGARRPVFGLRSAYFSYGITGGYFPDPQEVQKNVARGLSLLISGTRMSDVPFMVPEKSYPIVNYEQLERDRIPVSACPEDTVFINRPKTMWEVYKAWIIAGIILLLAVIGVAVTYLILQRRRMSLLHAHNRLVDTMPIGYTQATVYYDREGSISDISYHGGNRTFARILEENGGENGGKLFDDRLISREIRALNEKRSAERFSCHYPSSGKFYDFLLSVDSRGPANRVRELNVFAVDITESKKQEEALIAARERAQESDKLKMAFLANMSHEIRTPLNAIVGFSGLLAKTDDPEKKKKFVNIIETNNRLMLQLVGDVLDVAKVESNTLDFNFRPTDLNEVMRDAESMARLRLQPGVALNLTLGAPECVVDTDPNRLTQVLSNLLANAAKFTPRGSVTFGYELRADTIYFYVRDTGIGIPKESIPVLFTRFVKLDNFVQGTGLGLSISKSIVELMGGRIGVDSPGKGFGSTFWFTIPFRAPAPQR